MKMPTFTYHRPATVAEALAVLASEDDAKILAGGQSLIPLMAMRIGQPEHLVDIGRLDELDYIERRDDHIAVGALTRHAAAEDSALVQTGAPLLAAALGHVGHRAIRTRGTVCGSLAHADPAAELPAVALATGATFIARSTAGEREIPAADFFQGYLDTALEPNEMLAEVRFPLWPDRAGAAVVELSRRHGDYALVGLAAAIDLDDAGTIGGAALAFFGVGSLAVRIAEAEESLLDKTPGAEAFAAAGRIVTETIDAVGDNHGSAAYRNHIAGVLTTRGLAEAFDSIGDRV